MSSKSLQYTKGVIIVHGKSEFCLAKYIYTNLHLPFKIYAENKGRESIQINGLKKILNKDIFKNRKIFAKEYSVEYDSKSKELKNFKLFIIMDTDDCDEKAKNDYISGEMFKGHPLSDYIVPIFNINNLEDVMIRANIITKNISSADKGKYYSRIFPINDDPLSCDTIDQIKKFAERIKNLEQTNMLEFVDYCMNLITWQD